MFLNLNNLIEVGILLEKEIRSLLASSSTIVMVHMVCCIKNRSVACKALVVENLVLCKQLVADCYSEYTFL